MIGINNFGWRLCNQMFQLATAITLAKKAGGEVAFPEWKYAECFKGDFTPVPNDNSAIFKETTFNYEELPTKKKITIDGYFQSEKYFNDYADTIKEMFQPKDEIREELERKWAHEIPRKKSCAIHVRRGDYLQLPDHHPVQSMDYYNKAMELFPKDTRFLIFSDDTKWCYENFQLKDNDNGEGVEVVMGQLDIDDFFTMCMCSHNIIANSSFSWWPAWLNSNPDKIVVAPKNWFGKEYAHWDLTDLYPKGWVTI